MSKRNIYVVGHQTGYANWMEGRIVPKMSQADLVVFTGGEDINPEIYGAKPHITTQFNPERDAEEIHEFYQARAMSKKLIGICRGSQFLCAVAGGNLVQNQYHPSSHTIMTFDGQTITVTSSHHQRQYPWFMPANSWTLLGWTVGLSPIIEGDGLVGRDGKFPTDADVIEVENALYRDINALAIQSHPEWQLGSNPESIAYFRSLLDRFMDGAL